MSASEVTLLTTYLSHPVMVFGDTSAFTRFAQRTIEEPRLVRDFILKLWTEFFRYENVTGCVMKIWCDGFVAIHTSDQEMDSTQITRILLECDRLQKRIDSFIKLIPYPRPDGFRIRVTTGATGTITANLSRPIECEDSGCPHRIMTDTYGYPGILASRILKVRKEIPLICCEATYELATKNDKGDNEDVSFEKVKPDKRVPDGIFSDDIQHLWSFGRKGN